MLTDHFVRSFAHVARSPDPDLAIAALMIARIEYPQLDAAPYLDRLDVLGREAKARVDAAPLLRRDTPHLVDPERYARVMALNDYLFTELHFAGNSRHYQDPRNSFLNEVLDRRTGIPITLGLVYMEVARRAGLQVDGVNFPGHFLLRCRAPHGVLAIDDLIIDAFHGGAILSEDACLELLRRHAGDDAVIEPRVFARATKPQILARMLMNLKHLYVEMGSYPQARDAIELMLAVDPRAIDQLRDRGLLAYHLKDFSGALRDLLAYLQLSGSGAAGPDDQAEHAQLWEHVKTLRRRVASFN